MTIVLLNDGTKNFATKNDPTQHMLGSCFLNYRNTEEPVYVKVTYKEKTLSVCVSVIGFNALESSLISAS
jgi:hypothetical protein